MFKFRVNKDLLPVKVHYFLINGAHSAVIPIIAVYAKQMGISADALGYMFAFICCFTVISRSIFGGIVDYFQKLKLVLISLVIIDIAADMGLNFIPSKEYNQGNSTEASLFCFRGRPYRLQLENGTNGSNLTCTEKVISCTPCISDTNLCPEQNNQSSNFRNASYIMETDGSLDIHSDCIEHLIEECGEYGTNNNETLTDCVSATVLNPPLQFWMLSVFTAIIYICLGSINSLSDAACFNTLGSKPELFGRQRMWGTIGWGTFAFLVGYLNQIFTGTSNTYNYSAGFYMLVVLFAIDMAIIPKLKLKKVKTSQNICRDIGLLVVRPRVVLFIFQVFLVGVFIGMGRSYLFWYLRTLNASQLVLGCSSAVQCFLGELPFFFFAGWIIAKLGHVNTFTMSFVAHGAKFLCYSFLSDPWWCLPVEILQGPCFGSFYSAMASYAKIIAPEGTEATVQGLASGTFEGLGVAAGSLLGGYGFRNYGGSLTLFYSGIISMAIGLVNCVINSIMSYQMRNST